MMNLSNYKLSKLIKQSITIDILDSIDSTNEYIKKNKFDNQPSLVVSKEQTNGKGRFAKTFYSPLGGLYMSYRFQTNNDSIQSVQSYTMIAALAVIHSLKAYAVSAKIKWLNDIYINNQKLGGILCENILNNDNNVQSHIIGIGLNLFQSDNIPSNISSKYTALNMHTNITIDINTIISNIVNYINDYSGNFSEYLKAYKENSLILNKQFTTTNQKTYYAIDINSDGTLIARNKNDELETLNFTEISIVGID